MASRVVDILMQQGRDAANADLARGQAWSGAVQQLGQLPGQMLQMRDQQKMRDLQQQHLGLQVKQQQMEADATQRALEGQKQANDLIANFPRNPDGTFDVGNLLQGGAAKGVPLDQMEHLSKTVDGINSVVTSWNTNKTNHAADLADTILKSHSADDPVTADSVHVGMAAAKALGLASADEEQKITQALATGADPGNILRAIRQQGAKYKDEKPIVVGPEHALVTPGGTELYRAPAATPKPLEKPELQGQVVGSDGKVVPGTLTFEEHGRGYLLNGQPLPTGARVEHAPPPSAGSEADIDTAAKNIVNNPQDLTSLRNLSSLRGDQRLRLFNKIKELDPSFNVGMIDRRIKFLDEYEDPKGRAATNRGAMNNILQHAADLSAVNQQYRRSDVRIANTVINKLKEQSSTAWVAYQTPLAAIKDEIGLYFAGGYAPSVDQGKQWDKILSDNATPNQVEEFAKDIAHVALRRADTHNEQFRTMMGHDDPNLITPRAREAAERLGSGLSDEVKRFGSGGQIGRAPAPTAMRGDTPPANPKRDDTWNTRGATYKFDGTVWRKQ